MIEGYISNSGAPVLEVKVKGRRDEVTLEGILDTGFDGYRMMCSLELPS